jgi:hypothetical protein
VADTPRKSGRSKAAPQPTADPPNKAPLSRQEDKRAAAATDRVEAAPLRSAKRMWLVLAWCLCVGAAVAYVAVRLHRPTTATAQRGASPRDSSPPRAADVARALAVEATAAVQTPTPATSTETWPADGPPDSPLRIIAEPDQLRILDNTRVRMRIEPRDEVPLDVLEEFTKFTWHFEDGSEPAVGTEVEHTFGESVRDRHVTVEASRRNQPPLTLSKRLPVERLEVVPVDGEVVPVAAVDLPARKGTRVLFVAGAIGDGVRLAIAQAAKRTEADAVIVAGEPADVAALDNLLQVHAPTCAALHWDVAAGNPEAVQMRLLRDPQHILNEEQVGDQPTGVMAIRELAVVTVDTRAETVAEAELARARRALQSASAYAMHLLLSARPLTLLRDGELIADRAYRIYQHALKHQTSAVVSATSAVFYDGRFGGVTLVSVGRAHLEGCVRLTGQDACQGASVTLVEAGEKRRLTVLHLLGPQLDVPAQAKDLPPEVGTVRR